MLIIAVVHHGNCALLFVFNPGNLLCIKEAGLVTIQFTEKQHDKTVQNGRALLLFTSQNLICQLIAGHSSSSMNCQLTT